MEGASVICRGLALSEVVALHSGRVRADPFVIDLVEIVRLHDEAADYALTWRSLHNHLYFAKHKVEVADNSARVAALCDCKRRAIAVVRWRALGRELVRGAFCEVDG